MAKPTTCFDAVEITITLRRVKTTDIEPGDLIFCRRPGWLTTLNRSAGDPWRHVGIACWVDGKMSIVEVHDDLHTSRPIVRGRRCCADHRSACAGVRHQRRRLLQREFLPNLAVQNARSRTLL